MMERQLMGSHRNRERKSDVGDRDLVDGVGQDHHATTRADHPNRTDIQSHRHRKKKNQSESENRQGRTDG